MKFIPQAILIPLLSLTAMQKVHADEFHFGTAEAATKMIKGSNPDMIRGVLLDHKGDRLIIRLVGGTIAVPRSMVYKIVSDDLSVDDIEHEEAATAKSLAEANNLRIEFLADEAAERLARIQDARQHQADLEVKEVAELVHSDSPHHGLSYDPIIHRAIGPMLNHVVAQYIQSEYGGYLRRKVQRELRRRRR